MADYVVAKVSEIAQGERKIVKVGGQSIAIFNLAEKFYAIENTCPHQGGSLGEGELAGDTVACPLHAWTFNVKTGINTKFDSIKIRSFPVKVEGEDIKIAVD